MKVLSLAILCILNLSWAPTASAGSEALFGAAAVIATTVPAMVGGIESRNSQAIANINSNLAKYQVDAVAQNSVALARMQQQTAYYQTAAAFSVNLMNQQAVTQRLGMQLALADKLSMMTTNMKQMQFDAELTLKKMSLALQERQLNANIELGKAQQNLLAVQAGLSKGSVPMDSGASLSVTATGLAPRSGDRSGDGAANGNAATKLLSSIATTQPVIRRGLQAAPSPMAAAEPRSVGRAIASAGPTTAPSPLEFPNRAIRNINAYSQTPAAAPSPTQGAEGEALAVPFQAGF